MIAQKFFHEALENHENRYGDKYDRVEAVSHRMLTSKIMLAELSVGYGFRLVIQTGDDSNPKLKVFDGIGDHSE